MNKQKGFAHAFLIIGLVVALIGALGFVFWQNFIYEEPAATKTEVVKSDDPKNETGKLEESKLKTSSIDQYKVEFTLKKELEGTKIKYETRQIGEASFVAVTTQRAIDLGGDCAKGYPFGDLVRVERDTNAQATEYDVFTSDEIAGYYYHVSTVGSSGLVPGSTCTENPQALNDLNNLVESLRTLAPQN